MWHVKRYECNRRRKKGKYRRNKKNKNKLGRRRGRRIASGRGDRMRGEEAVGCKGEAHFPGPCVDLREVLGQGVKGCECLSVAVSLLLALQWKEGTQ